jgi:hypothetical protein
VRYSIATLWLCLLLSNSGTALAQQPSVPSRAPATPLSQETLDLLANEISGQMAYNNLVKLAGAPWLRDREEFTGTLYETEQIHAMARKYGIDTTRVERYTSSGTFDYPFEANSGWSSRRSGWWPDSAPMRRWLRADPGRQTCRGQ